MTIIKGGCQCGAVRYEVTGPLHNPHVCHCRMCQKAFGNFFAALVACKKSDITWIGEKPAVFRSSAIVSRGFCPSCGTPLSFAYDQSSHINVSIGSLDKPWATMPTDQYGVEAMHPAFPTLHQLPGSRTDDDISLEDLAKLKSLQHPDQP